MDIDVKVGLAARNTVEVVTVEELRKVFEEKPRPRGYIGFEPSGLVHVGWLVWMFKVRDLVKAGVDFHILEATWHAYINDKLGGDMELIRKAARYTRIVLDAIGVPESSVKYIDAEELASDKDYWATLLRAAKHTSLARVRRALTIMGRRMDEGETDFSKLIYPLMQVTDIFYLDLDIALGGMDQRKAHMLTRDIAERLGRRKPVAIHTPIITGLQGPGERMGGGEYDEVAASVKMSKSKPETAVFVHDSPEAVEAKILKAYCPPRTVEFNPIVEINKYLLFQQEGFKLVVERPEKYGGTIIVENYADLEKMYVNGEIHPLDLKKATANALNKLLDPIRRRIESDPEARGVLEELSKAKITR
ncbi:tyrosine--tRNA ligase [Desulfurococcus mucosus]|uniref:Tyrosine--tRNA ligase n=1 Tax=Desulfurococcus mucosus (strain ATCC 35584 / DSM 2162 / JCM 9187 / O7/1) TaxID=765177 RepID=E8R762_DESM0|nr:tyrosine--tRNA ligase [Desulfurococcus mucosus]ADV65527.1 tyrosyl-tRNA synthetase [Desulfurococcus mucosus DSM 2162]